MASWDGSGGRRGQGGRPPDADAVGPRLRRRDFLAGAGGAAAAIALGGAGPVRVASAAPPPPPAAAAAGAPANLAMTLGGWIPGTRPWKVGPLAAVPGRHQPARITDVRGSGDTREPVTFETSADGQVIQGISVRGLIRIRHQRVTLRDFRCWALDIDAGTSGHRLEWGTIGWHWGVLDPASTVPIPTHDVAYAPTDRLPVVGAGGGLRGSGYEMYRCEMFGNIDLLKPGNFRDITVSECWFHSMARFHEHWFCDPANWNPVDTSDDNGHPDAAKTATWRGNWGTWLFCHNRIDAWAFLQGERFEAGWYRLEDKGCTSGLFIVEPSNATNFYDSFHNYGNYVDGNYAAALYFLNKSSGAIGPSTPVVIADNIFKQRRPRYGRSEYFALGRPGGGTIVLQHGRNLDADTGAEIVKTGFTGITVNAPGPASGFPTPGTAAHVIRSDVVRDRVAGGVKVANAAAFSFPHTAGGAHPYLVVLVDMSKGTTTSATSVAFRGRALSRLAAVGSASGTVRLEVWGGHVSPGTGSVQVALSGPCDCGGGAISYALVDDTEPVDPARIISRTSNGTGIWLGDGVSGAARPGQRFFLAAAWLKEVAFTPAKGTAGGEIETGPGSTAFAWWDAPGEAALTGTLARLASAQTYALIAVPLNADVTPPDAPSDPVVAPAGPASATTAATMPGTPDTVAAHVRVADGTRCFLYDLTDGRPAAGPIPCAPGERIEGVTVPGLTSGAGYTVAWFAEDAAGNVSVAAAIDHVQP